MRTIKSMFRSPLLIGLLVGAIIGAVLSIAGTANADTSVSPTASAIITGGCVATAYDAGRQHIRADNSEMTPELLIPAQSGQPAKRVKLFAHVAPNPNQADSRGFCYWWSPNQTDASVPTPATSTLPVGANYPRYVAVLGDDLSTSDAGVVDNPDVYGQAPTLITPDGTRLHLITRITVDPHHPGALRYTASTH